MNLKKIKEVNISSVFAFQEAFRRGGSFVERKDGRINHEDVLYKA